MSFPSRGSHLDSSRSSSREGEAEESRETEREQDFRSMGLLALKRNHGRGQSDNGSAASLSKRDISPFQQDDNSHPEERKDDNSHGGKKARFIGPDLPEEIWHHIHSLVPMRDAARAACVSRSFLNSWRCHQNLTFTNETMCSKETSLKGTTDPNYRESITTILTVLWQIIETLITITPVMEKLTLTLSTEKAKYEFPCSLLSDRSGNTIRHLDLANCILHPTVNLNLRCLSVLDLYEVRITGGELGCLLSNSFALEKLTLLYCHDMIRLEVPCLLQRLSHLEVFECPRLQVIENKAPNISSFEYTGDEVVVNAAVIPSKFLHLKTLSITIRRWWSLNMEYDFLSLVSFLDASPSLETFGLSLSVEAKYDLFVGAPATLRQMPEHHHDKLKSVRITGFCAQKSLIELTRHILESSMSMKCLILDTIRVNSRCFGNISRKCSTLEKAYIKEACESILAIKTYIEGVVPSTARLHVLGLAAGVMLCEI